MPVCRYPHRDTQTCNQAPVGYLITQTGGTILGVNDTFLIWTGLKRDAVKSANLLDLFPVGDRIVYTAHARHWLDTGRVISELAIDLVGHNGHRHPVLLSATRSAAGPGKPAVDRIIVVTTVQRRRCERQMETALRRSEESDNARIRAEADAETHRVALAATRNELRQALQQAAGTNPCPEPS